MLGRIVTDVLWRTEGGTRKTEWWRDSSRIEYRCRVKKIDEVSSWRFCRKLMAPRGQAVSKNSENSLQCIDFYRALATAIVGVLEGVGRERALEMW